MPARGTDGILASVSWAATVLIDADNWQDSVLQLLRRLGHATGTNRVCLMENRVEGSGHVLATPCFEWAADGQTAAEEMPPSARLYPRRWQDQLARNEIVHGQMSDFTAAERDFLDHGEICSILAVPVFIRGNWWGALGFEERSVHRTWHAAEVEALKAVASILGAALHRRSEQAEAASRAHSVMHLLRAALESIDDGFAVFDANDRLVLCNERMRTISPTLKDVWVPGMLFRDIIRISAQTGEVTAAAGREDDWVRERLTQHRNPTASTVVRQLASGPWIQTKEMPIANGGIVLIRTDVTELKRRELDLEKSRAEAERAHQRLIDAIESLPDGFVYYDENDKLVAFNSAYLKTYASISSNLRVGRTFLDIAGEAWDAGFVHDTNGDKQTWLEHRLNAHRNPGPPIERRYSDNRWVRVQERRTSDGGYVTVGTDITELKVREQILRETEERFSGYFNHSPEALFVIRIEPDGRMIYEARNSAHAEGTGIPSEQVLGRTPEECLEPGMAGRVLAHYRQCIAAGTPIRYTEEHNATNRRTVWDTNLVPIRDRSGTIVRLLGSSRNITEQRRIESELVFAKEQAEASNRAKSNFLANMSHELRTPLNAVIGFSEILASELLGRLGSPKYVEYAQDIQRSGRHLLELINDILDMSRIEAGRYELSRENVEPPQLIGEVARLVSVNAAQAGVWLANTAPDDLPIMHIDRRAVRQVLLNLLSNAIKFTPKGGTVTIAAELSPQALTITVADSGIGIPKSDLPRLAKPFEQVDNVMTRRQEGSGLGLAISKALVELHRGSLAIESEVGVGTRVSFTLPR